MDSPGTAVSRPDRLVLGHQHRVYYELNKSAIVSDGFLGLAVEGFRQDSNLCLGYVLWEENDVVPQWVMEVSRIPDAEYANKMTKRAQPKRGSCTMLSTTPTPRSVISMICLKFTAW